MGVSVVNVNGTDYDIITKDSALPVICELSIGGGTGGIIPPDSNAEYILIGSLYNDDYTKGSVFIKTKDGNNYLSIIINGELVPSN